MELELRFKVFSSLFWISLHQGTLSVLCSRIQGHMLSLMNEVDPCIAFTTCFVSDAKPVFPTKSTQEWYTPVST